MTSIIKVNNLQNQCGANIISESSNTITIGASGDTVTLAAGASQSGFGRSGSVNWDTTPKTTSPVTAVSGNGYFIDTTSGAITINLPATPAAGDIVAIADYNGTATANNITVGRNSSDINGSAADFIISKNYAAISFVYVDATAGWRSVDTSNITDVENQFVSATGGTITTCGDYKIHSFTGPGTFTVTNAGSPLGSTTVDYLVVAGGAGGGASTGGGGGAGGYRESSGVASGCYSASPLGSGVSALPVTAQGYPITVGGGGTGGGDGIPNDGGNGSNSVFSTITSTGGGGGGGEVDDRAGLTGGSGGGGSIGGGVAGPSGAGNTPPTSPPQGNPGGNAGPGTPIRMAGGGGGAGTPGSAGTSPGTGGGGGSGATSSINASPTTRAGGGGGGGASGATPAPPAPGGGGVGGIPAGPSSTAGATNTGSGGGGGADNLDGSAGGSGIVIIRYKFQ